MVNIWLITGYHEMMKIWLRMINMGRYGSDSDPQLCLLVYKHH